MADKIAEAVLKLTVDSQEYDLTIKKIPKDADKAATSIRGIGQAVDLSVFKELGQTVGNALQSVGAAFVDLVERGGEVTNIESAFDSLTSAIGETKDSMVSTSRDATQGLISDFDLMAAGNKALLLGLPVTADSFGTLAKTATVLGRAMGQDAKKSFDDLITSLGRGSSEILDNLGITVKVGEANEAYAKKLGIATSALTDADKKTAFYDAAMGKASERLATMGDLQLTLSDRLTIARNTFQNLTDALGVAINKSPVFAAGAAAMGKALGDAFGTDQKSQVSDLTKLAEKFAIGLTYVAQGAQVTGTIFVTVFSAIETLINGILTVVVGLGTGIVSVVDGLAQMQASLPFASQGAKDLAANTSALRTYMDAMTNSLAASTAEAAKGVIGQGALHAKLDAVGGVILRVRDAMEAAEGKTEIATKALVKHGDTAKVTADKTQEAASKIAEAFRALNDEIGASTRVGLDRRLFEIESAREKELAGLQAFKFESQAQHDEMERLILEKYRLRVAAAILAGDEIKAKEREVQNDIALQLTAGTANKILQLQIARDKEIEGLEFLKTVNRAQYDADVAAVTEKFRLQINAAQGYYENVALAASAAGFKTRTELEAEAANAMRLYKQMEQAGTYTPEVIHAAHKKATDAQMALDGTKAKFSIDTFQGVASSASSILRELFGKNKAAAIAATAIDAAAAIVKAFAQGGILGFASAAAITAATASQIKTIKNQSPDGFAQGTPGLDFMDFGAQSFQPLHNQEAVIPRGGGHMLAGEIADSMSEDAELVPLVRRLVELMERAPDDTGKAFRKALVFARI